MSRKLALALPSKLWIPAEQDTTKWYILQLLDPKLDWRAALADARLRVDGDSPALEAPNGAGLGLQVDDTSAPAQMLVLKPSADGSNTVLPSGRVSACIKIGSRLSNGDSQAANKAGSLKLTPLPTGEVSNNVPVAYWRLGPSISDETVEGLSFSCIGSSVTDRTGELTGRIKAAPKMQLVGKTLNLKDATYLVGAQPQGSKKLLLYEAEVYWVERNGEFGRNKAEELRQEAEERRVLDYRAQRSEAIQLAGGAQKKRQDASKALRMVDENKVADLEECMAELTSRANGLKDMDAIRENDALKMKQELVPAFDLTASDPRQIYAKGLARMLPDRILEAEPGLRDDRMVVFLQAPGRATGTPLKELQEIFKSQVAAQLVLARAEANHPDSFEDAERTAKRFTVMNALIKLNGIKKKPRLNFAQFQAELDITSDNNKLANHLFDYFGKASPIDKRTRVIHAKKLVCHLIILVLDLSWRYKVDLMPLQDALRIDIKEMEENARYLGCETHKKLNPDNQTTLETELKAPLSFSTGNRGGPRKRKR